MSMPVLEDGRPSTFSLRGELDRWDIIFLGVIAITVYVTRQIFAGPAYFVDGPLLVNSIRMKWFVIQSPGYWLYAHLGGLFPDPEAGLAFWNKTFSALGASAFFLLTRMLGTQRRLALPGALAYSSLYYVWFAGEIHSSYAAEILFPVLTLCCFLKLQERRAVPWSAASAISAGLAVALRPSDGIFLFPLWLYLLWSGHYQKRITAVFLVISSLLFLAWYLPTQQASRVVGFNSTESQLMVCLQTTSVFFIGFSARWYANIIRVFIPILVACWPLIPLWFQRRPSGTNVLLVLWAIPGLLFFTLGYMADPTYIVYLSGSFVLAVILQRKTRLAITALSACLIWNCLLFTLASPVANQSTAGLVWNFAVPKYCSYGIRHRWTATIRQAVLERKEF